MFSGIIEDIAGVERLSVEGDGRRVVLRPRALPLAEVKLGDSIAVNGVCLTVEGKNAETFAAVMGKETLAVTALGALKAGSRVHLERALQLSARLDGHLVAGHVDGVGRVRSAEESRESVIVWVEAPIDLQRFIATKGSVCLDGVSLTVNEVDGARFRVNIVPYTTEHTNLGSLRAGDALNIEVDLIARYVERLLSSGGPSGLTAERMRELGFGKERS